MNTRRIGPFEVTEIGLGCMNLSHAYGTPPSAEEGKRLLHHALDLGISHFDTAALYGFGRNETLVGEALQGRRDEIVLASKCGMTGVDGKRVIDGRPETLIRTCKDALQRLRTDVIDLYYLHRWDKRVPIEDSVGALARLVHDGVIRAIGLSEVSAATLRRAHAEHSITAIQSEYSLWSRNVEIGVLEACRELNIAFVAFSPLARGFLAGEVNPLSFTDKDIRRTMPRFMEPAFGKNLELLAGLRHLARENECTSGQLALAWLLYKAPFIVPIVGTTSIAHLEENIGASAVKMTDELATKLEALINQKTVSGRRYPSETQKEIDTEQFADEL